MKIVVRSSEAETVSLRLPGALALNSVSTMILLRILKRNGINISREQVLLLVRTINRFRCSHPGWKLVEVECADGKHIEISV